MQLVRKLFLAFPFVWFPVISWGASPEGVWKTIDDETGKERSFVELRVVDGELTGVIRDIIPLPGDSPDQLCDKCKGELKDQPVVGMRIIWGLTEEDGVWAGGLVLDPKNGKIYKCKITPSEDGRSLEVRGYLGVSIFGRSQTWYRTP